MLGGGHRGGERKSPNDTRHLPGQPVGADALSLKGEHGQPGGLWVEKGDWLSLGHTEVFV